jgi:hypothetical protein
MCKALPKTGTLELGSDTTPPGSVISTKPEEVREADDRGRVERSRESLFLRADSGNSPRRLPRNMPCGENAVQRHGQGRTTGPFDSLSVAPLLLAQGDSLDLPLLSRSFFINISLSSFAGETTPRSLQECISLPKEGNVPTQNGKSTAHAGAGYPAHNFISSPSH